MNSNKNYNSIILAILICGNIVSIILNKILKINNTIILVFSILFFISFLLNRFKYIIKNFNKFLVCMFILSYIFIFFLIAFIQVNDISYVIRSLQNFICFGLISFYIAFEDFDINKVLDYIIYIYLISIFYMVNLNISNMDPGNKMGMGYIILIPIIVCIYRIFFDNRRSFNILVYVDFIVYVYFFIVIASRGPIISVIIFILFMSLKKINNIFLRFLFFFGTMISVYLISKNMINILEYLKILLNQVNIESSFIDHSIYQINIGNVLNGRLYLFNAAFEGFLNSIFIGNGIGAFEAIYKTYPHNFILQSLYDGGIFFTVPLIIILLKGIIIFFSNNFNNKEKDFLIIIFCLVVPKLLFSSELWKEQIFWILIIYILNLKRKKGENYEFI